MTPNEYRKKHRRCATCKYLQYEKDLCLCIATNKVTVTERRLNILKGRLCKIYNPILLKEEKHEKRIKRNSRHDDIKGNC